MPWINLTLDQINAENMYSYSGALGSTNGIISGLKWKWLYIILGCK